MGMEELQSHNPQNSVLTALTEVSYSHVLPKLFFFFCYDMHTKTKTPFSNGEDILVIKIELN